MRSRLKALNQAGFTALVLALAGFAVYGVETPESGAPAVGLLVGPSIQVTINPEGRISAILGGPLPPFYAVGKPVVFRVNIVNQGFVTAPLEAEWVGSPSPGAELDYRPEPLKGAPYETRSLSITLTNAAPTDLTLAFKLHNEVPDLGGRDRIHLLMRGR